MKIQLFKKKNKFSHSKWSIMSPGRHWHIALALASFLVVASFAFGLYLFIEENRAIDSLSLDDGKVAVDTISYERIKKVLDIFTEREKRSEEILNSPASFSDPSL
jgi:hypothetical protein